MVHAVFFSQVTTFVLFEFLIMIFLNIVYLFIHIAYKIIHFCNRTINEVHLKGLFVKLQKKLKNIKKLNIAQ